MKQVRIKMKAVAQPAESEAAPDRYAELAAQVWEENSYLPSQDDQSWREQAALRIAAGYEEPEDDMAPDIIPVREEDGRLPGADPGGKGRGGILVALFMIAVIVPIVAVLTAPDILTIGFWRGHRAAPTTAAKPAGSFQTASASQPTSRGVGAPMPRSEPAAPTAMPQLKLSTDTGRSEGRQSVAQEASETAHTPTPRPATRMAERDAPDDGNADKFRTLVVGTDGTLKYEYFPSRPSTRAGEAGEGVREEADTGGGFYAMVPDPDGTLRYKYFPSKPTEKEKLGGMR